VEDVLLPLCQHFDAGTVRCCYFVKAKFHYASWFEAGSELVQSWSPTSFKPDIVMEFGFKPNDNADNYSVVISL